MRQWENREAGVNPVRSRHCDVLEYLRLFNTHCMIIAGRANGDEAQHRQAPRN